MFFSSSNSGQKRNLALLHAVKMIFEANTNPKAHVKSGQDNFLRILIGGLSYGNPLFAKKAESMSDLEMASILRSRSNFDKRSIAETLTAAYFETGYSPEAKETVMKIAFDSDIPRNYFKF